MCAEALTLMECVQNTTAEKKIGSIENLKAVTQKGLANAAQARNRFIHTHSTWEAVSSSVYCLVSILTCFLDPIVG